MKINLKIFFVLTSFLFHSAANGLGLPRMWEVTRTDSIGHTQKLFILGVTHNGLDIEYDDYFYQKIFPAFRSASILYSESAILSSAFVPECTQSLLPTKENLALLTRLKEIVKSKYLAEISKGFKFDSYGKDELDEIQEALTVSAQWRTDKLSEYGLLIALMELSKNKEDANTSSQIDVVTFLKQHRNSSTLSMSIDTPEDMLKAYCDLKTERGNYIQLQLMNTNESENQSEIGKRNSTTKAQLILSIQNGWLSPTFNAGAETDASYVCNRNRNWLRLIMNTEPSGTQFYALGFSHLLPAEWRSKDCPDLLTLLREAGMSVKLIR